MKPLGLTWFGFIYFGAVAADQLTKWLIRQSFEVYHVHPVIPDLFNLVYYTNNGAAFSMLAGQPALWRQIFFISTTLIALVIIAYAHRSYSRQNGWYTVALALIAGGATGNLIDRLNLGFVVDFLDVYYGDYHWPAFNVADSAITVGVALFIVVSIFFENKKQEEQ